MDKTWRRGTFPLGLSWLRGGEIISSELSSPYPGLFHADSKAVSQAFKEHGVLTGATLYIGLESCLMCLGVAYWAGIRRIVYAVPKSKVSGDYYETPKDTSKLIKTFNEKMELLHIEDLENEALDIIRSWEKKFEENK